VQVRLLLLQVIALCLEVGASLGKGVQSRLQLRALLLRLRQSLHFVQLAGALAVALYLRLDGFEPLVRGFELLPLDAQLLDAPFGVLVVVLQQGVLPLEVLVLLAQGGLHVVVGARGVAHGNGLL